METQESICQLLAEVERLTRDLSEATHVIERLCDAAGQAIHGDAELLARAVDLAVRFMSAGQPAPVDVLREVEQGDIEVIPWPRGIGPQAWTAWHKPTGVAMVVASSSGESGQLARERAVSRLNTLLAEATTAWRER